MSLENTPQKKALDFICECEAKIKIYQDARISLSETLEELHGKASRLACDEELLWNVYAKTYPALQHLRSYRRLQKKVMTALTLKKGMRLADLGCGVGLLETRLEIENILAGLEVVCLEKSAAMRDQVSQKNWFNVVIKDSDLTEPLPIESNSADRVVCTNVFGFLTPEKSDDFLAEVYRITKQDGGKFILTTQKKDFDLGQILREQAGEDKSLCEKWRLKNSEDFGWMLDVAFSKENPEMQKDFLLNILANLALLKRFGNSAPQAPEPDELQEMLEIANLQVIEKDFVYAGQYIFIEACPVKGQKS